MAAFYARYMPSTKPNQPLETRNQSLSKRKYEGNDQDFEESQKRAKTETGNKADGPTQKQSLPPSKESRSSSLEITQARHENDSIPPKITHSGEQDNQGKEVLARYSSVETAEKLNSTFTLRRKNGSSETRVLDSGPGPAETSAVHREKKKRKKRESALDEAVSTRDEDQLAVHADKFQPIEDLSNQRHAGVRRKFEASKAKARINPSSRDADDQRQRVHINPEGFNGASTATVQLHGLEPLPQPPQAEPSTELPTYSVLPGWMATPLRVSSSSTTDFQDLKLDKRLISNLQAKGMDKAFAVQATVLPLLSAGNLRHRGDICISAATGSGKTLAYVLPLIQALKDMVGTKLRGLIVVPTRELVVQAREVCEVCAAGTNVRIATALGSKALKDEQNILVEQHTVYDPEQYKCEREQPIDWTSFGLEDILAQSDENTPITNHVKKFVSKVDVLITTPGRLVDHLRSTPGFNLDDVQWVVIDEADRLLNESFQEWIEVVMPALDSDTATRSRDELLQELRLEVPERIVQKVILSATMTQDISKLNSLNLRNPKLVVIGDLPKPEIANEHGIVMEDNDLITKDDGIFNLPLTLIEFAVSAGDGSEKPLYLLELLNSYILKPPEQRNRIHASFNKPSPKAGLGIHNVSSLESDDTSGSDTSDTSDSDSSDGSPNSSSSTTSVSTAHLTQTALIFARSTEAAIRLSRLLCLLSPSLTPRLGTLTKSSKSSSSRKTLSQFRQGKLTFLVATDRASRGLDLPGLAHVVSYDIPTSATTYIHRVGRTARAGKEGKAWTLVGHREARWFWNEIGKPKQDRTIGEVRVGRGDRKVKRVNIEIGGNGDDERLRERYMDALRVLEEEVKGDV